MRIYVDEDRLLRRDLVIRPVEELRLEVAELNRRGDALMGNSDWIYEDLDAVDGALHDEMLDYDSAIAAIDRLVRDVSNLVSARRDPDRLTLPLRQAASMGLADQCRALIERGAEFMHPDDNGWAALQHAAANGHTAVCELLLRHGASLDALRIGDLTPFQLAVLHGHLDTVDYFVREHDEDLEERTAAGQTLDQLAASGDDNDAMVRHLMIRQSEKTIAQIDSALAGDDRTLVDCVTTPPRATRSFSL